VTVGLLALTSRSSAAQVSRPSADPVANDPAAADTATPYSTEELAFESHGARLNGFMYVAGGKGPHPTVILLHGFPGNERNLDLAQVFRRAGMNVLFFDYRGSWGSGGTFSFAHSLEDVASAIGFVRRDSSVAAFRSDPGRVILVGHSMGGWLALEGAAADSSISCAAALDFWNVGADGRRMRSDRARDSTFAAYAGWVTAPGGPLHTGDGAESLRSEVKDHGAEWDLAQSAKALRSRPVLLVSTTANEQHARLVAALRAAGGKRVEAVQWKTDHSFSDRRVRLARTILGWLRDQCESQLDPGPGPGRGVR
jgi:dipeptidyl aminopeptidase/acylaminoacyl peptidase